MSFVPQHQDEFWSLVKELEKAALEYASILKAKTTIAIRVERLKPVHLDLTDYKFPVGEKTYTLKSNVGIFFGGFFSNDTSFDYIKWWNGAKTVYIGDWFTREIAYFQEKLGMWRGNLGKYQWKGDETFTVNAHSTTSPTPTTVDAWPVAYAVLPETLAETKIIV
jgi:hypothetical protein